MYHYTDGGLRNVWLVNGYEHVQTPYGDAIRIQDLPGLIRALGQALIRQPRRLTGAEFRYLRQAMLMSQAALGKALGRSDQSVAGWEKHGRVPKFADQLLRVLYAAHADGNERVKHIIHAMNDVERTLHFIMRETDAGWVSEVSSEEVPLSKGVDQEVSI